MTTAANVTLYIGSAILSIYFVGGVYKEYATGASIMEASETPVAALKLEFNRLKTLQTYLRRTPLSHL